MTPFPLDDFSTLPDKFTVTIGFIFRENMHGYLSADIICSLLGTDNARGQISVHIFAQNGGYCLCVVLYRGV